MRLCVDGEIANHSKALLILESSSGSMEKMSTPV
jgi:hypothetical protein